MGTPSCGSESVSLASWRVKAENSSHLDTAKDVGNARSVGIVAVGL